MDLLTIVIIITLAAYVPNCFGQENAQFQIPKSLEECYRDPNILERDNRLPMTMPILIDLIRKVENSQYFNQDIQKLAVSLVHRFRQDGIQKAEGIPTSPSVLPYSPFGFQFPKCRILLSKLIPGNAYGFPNETLTPMERCTLHFMLSASIETKIRGDENKCNQLAQFRSQRIPRQTRSTFIENINDNFLGDVEILNFIKQRKLDLTYTENTRPTEKYPKEIFSDDDFESNADANVINFGSDDTSQCPVENGVIWTPWGAISGAPLITGIAAGLVPENVFVNTLLQSLRGSINHKSKQQTSLNIDNKWAATLAGDLAEVTLIQIPMLQSQSQIVVGAPGEWNQTVNPTWYFLTQREHLQITDAEIRGGLDALIMASSMNEWTMQVSNMKLSQLLDMFYSQGGVLGGKAKACDRKNLFNTIAPINTIVAQTASFGTVLDKHIRLRVSLKDQAIANFSRYAADALSKYVSQHLNDLSCTTSMQATSSESISIATDLYIFIDTTWPYEEIYSIVGYLLNNIDVRPYGSSVTILNTYDGQIIANRTYYLSEIYQQLNRTNYNKHTPGFNLPNILKVLHEISVDLMNNEKKNSTVGGRSLIGLIIPQMSGVSEADNNYAIDRLQIIRDEVPDLKILFAAGGSVTRFAGYVQDEKNDLFSIRIGENIPSQVEPLIVRLGTVPRRIINPRCGPLWQSNEWGINQMSQYVIPGSLQFYRMSPNYFYQPGSNRHLKIKGEGVTGLTVCYSRWIERPKKNFTQNTDIICTQLSTDSVDLDLSNACGNSWLIRECQPIFISVEANSISGAIQAYCKDDACRTPIDKKFTVHIENFGCYSSCSRIVVNVLMAAITVLFSLYL